MYLRTIIYTATPKALLACQDPKGIRSWNCAIAFGSKLFTSLEKRSRPSNYYKQTITKNITITRKTPLPILHPHHITRRSLTHLTRVERDLADEDPLCREVELQHDEPAVLPLQVDGHVAGVLQGQVGHVGQ